MRPPRKLLLLLLPALLVARVPAQSTPDVLNYQGVLRDAQGQPLDGAFDMVFRFWDGKVGGNELAVDTHAASNGDPVTVSGGLFDVRLGAHLSKTGPPYTSLAEMFRDHTAVWLEIEVRGEVLTPRLQVLATAYAHNAENLAGRAGDFYLDTSSASQKKAGVLTVGQLDVSGSKLLLNASGPDKRQVINFWEDGLPDGETLEWDDAADTFRISDSLEISGGLLRVDGDLHTGSSLFMNHDGPDGDSAVWFYDSGSLLGEWLLWDDSEDRFELSNELFLGETLWLNGYSPYIFFELEDTGTYEWLRLGLTYNQFELSTGLEVNGPLLARYSDTISLSASDQCDPTNYPCIHISTFDEPYISLSGATDRRQSIYFFDDGASKNESFRWADGNDRFAVTDDFHVGGDLSASGTKPFVQNHPYRDDLEVVYVALEGDQAATFTRGFGRLEAGVASVPLGETFALVTNPDLGLSAHLTPRGKWADLYVDSLTTEELVVRSRDGGDVAFDYIVFGLRIGYEEFPVLRARRIDAPVPPEGFYEAEFELEPELREQTPLSRFTRMTERARGVRPVEPTAARALRAAIGERDPSEIAEPGGSPAARQPGLEVEAPSAPMTQAAAAGSGPTLPPGATGSSLVPRDRPDGDTGRLPASWTVTEPVRTADVVVLDPTAPGALRLGDRAFDPGVAGCISEESSLAAGDPGEAVDEWEAGALAPLAVSGVAVCKVDAAYGAIAVGDPLTTSPTPGHAMRAGSPLPGTVLGKAIEPFDHGTGSIRVLVTLR